MAAVGFAEFVWIWNTRQGQATPRVHLQIARWLAGRWQEGERELLLLAFRSSGKSTLVGLFCAWLLLRKPDLRILVLAGDFALAKKMVRNVKRIIERHPLTAGLKPARSDHWASDQFTVKRGAELRDPSMLAKGIAANITGLRADIVICDDVEVQNTCDTAPKRGDLRARLRELEYVVVPGACNSSSALLTPTTRSMLRSRDPNWAKPTRRSLASADSNSRFSTNKAAADGLSGSRPSGSRPSVAERGQPSSKAK
jgi:hypothetical protein